VKAWEIRHGNLCLADVDSAHPLGNETVVRVSHVGICGSDVPKLLNPHDFALPEPWRPGHEIVGTDPTGRTVAVDPLVPCGTCPCCVAGDTHLCASLRRIGWDLLGGFAEQVVIPAENAHPLPFGADPLVAVLADPAAVAIHGLRCSPVTLSGRLAVIGAGTIGLLTALYAHQQGWEVTVVHREGRAPHETVPKAVPAIFRSPATLAPNEAFDVVVDAASGADPAPLALALRLVDDSGTIVVQNAYYPGVTLPMPLRDAFRRSIRLIGSFSHCRRRPGDFILALDFLHSHAARVSHLVAEADELSELPAVLSRGAVRSVRPVLAVRTP
jgi:threonine dehydrogenase-like Zn-dependent dehydrogenase